MTTQRESQDLFADALRADIPHDHYPAGTSHQGPGGAPVLGLPCDAACSGVIEARKWVECGSNVFDLTESLAAVLLSTDVTLEDLQGRQPFDSFIVQVPPAARLGFGRFAASFRAGTWLNRLVKDPVGWMYVDELDRGFEFIVPDGHGGSDTFLPPRTYRKPHPQHDLLVRLERLVVGLCVFLDAELEPREATTTDRTRPTKRHTIQTVGRSVKISSERRAAAFQHRGPPLWFLNRRVPVRSHGRWQPVGRRLPDGAEGPRNARRIRIAPYEKGPEGAEVWQRLYEVGAE